LGRSFFRPPGGLIREDRPEKIREQRELHATLVVVCRIGAVLLGGFMLVSAIVVLALGPG
jgi:hypothetical protein